MTHLVKWERMKFAIAESHSIDEVKYIRDKAEAYRYAMKQAKEAPEQVRKVSEIKIRAERRAGELLLEMPKAEGAKGNPGGQGAPLVRSQDRTTQTPTYSDIGIDKRDASKWQKIAEIPEDEFEKYIAVAPEISTSGTLRLATQIIKGKRIKSPPLPEDKYRIVYADPPWAYGNYQPEYHPDPASHYPLMTVQEISNMPVPEITTEDAVLFLWVTCPILEESFQVVSAWGFKYKTNFIWDKIKHNMGHYSSVRHEILLVCVKGSCQPDIRKLFDSVQSIERTGHSVKPEKFREIISTIYPYGKRIELFAREGKQGWDSYGNEIKTP